MSCAVVIPARMESTRFPGKPLCDLMGKPMVQWVVEAATAANITDRIVVATPNPEIIDACRAFGAEAILTRNDHVSGTDRIAEAAGQLNAAFYINVQGDEPLVHPDTIRAAAQPLIDSPEVQMASVWCPCTPEELDNPAAVKVVTDLQGNALYFSRHSIPFQRADTGIVTKKHIGIYVYRHDVLMEFSKWQPTPLEQTESLEQLRFLENGIKIRMCEGKNSPVAVDTPEQAEQVRQILASGQKLH